MAQVDAQNQFRRFLPLFSFSFLFVLLYCERRKLLKAAAADSSVQVGADEDHALLPESSTMRRSVLRKPELSS